MEYIRTDYLFGKIVSHTKLLNGTHLFSIKGLDEILPISEEDFEKHNLKIADTIEELCDFLIIKTKDYRGFKGETKVADLRLCVGTKEDLHNYLISQMKPNTLFEYAYLGIETNKGLIYVAKMNEKGELELL